MIDTCETAEAKPCWVSVPPFCCTSSPASITQGYHPGMELSWGSHTRGNDWEGATAAPGRHNYYLDVFYRYSLVASGIFFFFFWTRGFIFPKKPQHPKVCGCVETALNGRSSQQPLKSLFLYLLPVTGSCLHLPTE